MITHLLYEVTVFIIILLNTKKNKDILYYEAPIID